MSQVGNIHYSCIEHALPLLGHLFTEHLVPCMCQEVFWTLNKNKQKPKSLTSYILERKRFYEMNDVVYLSADLT